MAGGMTNLKTLLIMIKDNKDFDANLILDEGCILNTDDQTSLIKVLNYLINYLKQLTDKPLEIGLDLRSADYLLSMMAFTDRNEFPEMSDSIEEALKPYKATHEIINQPGKYIQSKITFKKD